MDESFEAIFGYRNLVTEIWLPKFGHQQNYVAPKYVATERPNQAMLAEVVQRIYAEIMICQATNVLCMLTVLIRFQSVSIQTLCHTST